MGFIILLIVGIFVLWLWVRGNPLGALGMVLALIFIFGPAAHPDWSWTNLDDVKLIALFVVISIAPCGVKQILREQYLTAQKQQLAPAAYVAPVAAPVNKAPALMSGIVVAVALTAVVMYHVLHH